MISAIDGYDVLIVGSGHGGAQAAAALRQSKFTGSIGLLGDETELPYERPPLSKDYLSGERTLKRILLRPASFWSAHNIKLLPGRRVLSVDPIAHSVTCADGASIAYGTLIWAAGGTPRRLTCAGHDLENVQTVRTRADADRIAGELPSVARVVVIGGGYIGLEAAAVLNKLGKGVTIVEALDRVLARVAGEPLSRFFEREHRSHGVQISLGAPVDSLIGDKGRVTGVKVADGRVLPADMVIVGIGIIPAVEPLMAAGAKGGNGVAVDEQGRTSLADVFAIGDCALHENPYANGAPIRLESVQNAHDMALNVAQYLVGNPRRYDAVPWFWSNQYDLRLQTIGLSIAHDQSVIRGEVANRSFSIIYLRKGEVIALDCVNAPGDFVQGKALVAGHCCVAPELLANTTISLASMA